LVDRWRTDSARRRREGTDLVHPNDAGMAAIAATCQKILTHAR
jgi:lysophospholipase L1-like esterase